MVVDKQTRAEKHPGEDDVYLVELRPARTMQVDRQVYEAVERGDTISKSAWSRHLERNADRVELRWSSDAHGMMWQMPLVVLMLVTSVWLVARPS